MNNTILVDVDDTVAELVNCWLKRYNADWNDWITEPDIKSWAIDEYVKCGKDIYKYLNDPTLYDNVIPVRNAKNGINILRAFGFRIVFVTSTPTGQEGRKFKWLCDWGFLSKDMKKDYIEATDKSLIIGSWLIDDNPENIANAYGQGIVFTRQWNKSLEGYPRMNDWNDIVNYFRSTQYTYNTEMES